jgi:hypothetical protein
MDSQGEISPGAIVGAVFSLIIAAVVGLIGLRILSPFAARCDDSGAFAEACLELSSSVGSTIAALVGPLGLIVVLVLLLIFISSGR